MIDIVRMQEKIISLEKWFNQNFDKSKSPIKIKQIEGGQSNPTYLIERSRKKYILRSRPTGKLLPSAHAIDREFRILDSLYDTVVPVPEVYIFCEDEKVFGSSFYLMEFLEGRIFYDPTLPGVNNYDREKIFYEMIKVLANLHKLDYKKLGLNDFGKENLYVNRQVKRWTEQYRKSESKEIKSMEYLIEWVPKNIPNESLTSIVHGDYRIDNLIFHPKKPEVIGVLDWEISTLGNPYADFAYNAMIWRLTKNQFRGLKDSNLLSLGIPSEKEYYKKYLEFMGIDGIPSWNFYIIYNMFRLAAILQGIAGRVRDGTASSPEASKMEKLVKPIADSAWKQAKGIV